MSEEDHPDAHSSGNSAIERAAGMARAALILSAMALAVAILGLVLPIR
jgi:hypothetical protein